MSNLKNPSWVAQTKSNSTQRLTPLWVLDLIRQVSGPIQLDPCAHPASFVAPKHSFCLPARARDLFDLIEAEKDKPTKEAYQQELNTFLLDARYNGLLNSWRGYGLVFVNPPYQRSLTKQWIQKIITEFEETEGSKDELYALLPARMGSVWFQDLLLPRLDAFCLFKGRLLFESANRVGEGALPDSAPFESILVYIGQRPMRFIKAFQKMGWCKLHPFYRIVEVDDLCETTVKVFPNE